ncbi:MAG: cell division protein ZapA (FtsZ GTPase activity inhibitor) [Dasania sp.]|jgi:cell division protein ZapA (FtsZ GTPase activity inhibitor)
MTYHSVTILQKNYNISCAENEVPRLEECTKSVNDLLGKIFNASKSRSETTVMAMALLTIMDELLDHKNNANNANTTNLEHSTHIIPQDMLERLENISQAMVQIS